MRIAFASLLTLLAFQAAAITVGTDTTGQQAYDPGVPRPAGVLGFEPGTWYARPDAMVRYLEVLAESSPRVRFEVAGRSVQQRPQVLLTISSPDNLARLDSLREQRMQWLAGERDDPGPMVLWFGYSIHGDEASGSNASMLFAYHLAALDTPEHDALLQDTIILIDPSQNPDGMGRYAEWVNASRSRHPVSDPIHREHHQPWVRGRLSHYRFDLNRDWLPLTHPESRTRVSVLRRWRPTVVTDFHETRGYDNYFFQPGVPDRTHPLTPARNQELTALIARFHAAAFDRSGEAYFAREGYDDFYYGKGSTYPDVQGMVGILFEQPSSRGQVVDLSTGRLSFERAIGNQLTTSLSTLAAADDLRDELQQYQAGFRDEARRRIDRAGHEGWVFGETASPSRGRMLAELLDRHGIEVRELSRSVEVEGQRFRPGSAWVVPADQAQFPLVEAVFERRTRFENNTFYDVSAWTLPLAYDLPAATLRRLSDLAGEALINGADATPQADDSAYAWALPWTHVDAPAALQRLHQAGVRVNALGRALTAKGEAGPVALAPGDLVVLRGQNRDLGDLAAIVSSAAASIPVTTLRSGAAVEGPDLGSPTLEPLKPVRPLLLVGQGVDASESGEVWYLLDTRVGLPLTQVELRRLDSVRLSDFTHLLMVDGRYDGLTEAQTAAIRQWIGAGGVLVASKSAAAWATDLLKPAPADGTPAPASGPPTKAQAPSERRPYGEARDDWAETAVGGAIVSGEVDLTHPLAFGLQRPTLPLFRDGTTVLAPSENPYETVIRYAESPLLSGFLGQARQRQIGGSAALIATRVDAGLVLRLADNPNFRGYWVGTQRLYLNALFLSGLVIQTPVADTESRL